jgi:hypothetical protein
LKAEIEATNQEVLQLNAKYAKANALYNAELGKPDKVRYEYVYRYIDKGVDSNECEDIKNAIDSSVEYINSRVQ